MSASRLITWPSLDFPLAGLVRRHFGGSRLPLVRYRTYEKVVQKHIRRFANTDDHMGAWPCYLSDFPVHDPAARVNDYRPYLQLHVCALRFYAVVFAHAVSTAS